MKNDAYGQPVFSEQDLIDLCMQGRDLAALGTVLVDQSVDLSGVADLLTQTPTLSAWQDPGTSVAEFDQRCQQHWLMPQHYQELDIAEHVLMLCQTDAELQRCGQELLMFQERGLFDLLKYLKYLVDVMRENHMIWGVGRGSSVASYVLYKLGVHRIDSLYYDLDPQEFLR